MHKSTAVLIGFCVAMVLAFCFVIPVRLLVDIAPGKANQFEKIEKEDVTVYPSALFRKGTKSVPFRFVKESTDDYDDVIVATTFLTRRIHMRNLAVTSLKAVYSGTVAEGDPILKNRIVVTAKFKNGQEETVKDIELYGGTEQKVSRASIVTVGTKYGACPVTFTYNEPVRLSASYDETPYQGGRFNMKAVKVKYIYDDDSEKAVTPLSCEGPPTFTGITTYVVYTPHGRVTLPITPVRIKHMLLPGEHYAHEAIKGDITVVYDDGTEKQISADDVKFKAKREPLLVAGTNRIQVEWNGTECSLYAFAYQFNNVTDLLISSEDEINQSKYNSLTSSFFMTIRDVNAETPYTLTHIAIAKPEQIRVSAANGAVGTGTETPESAAIRTGWAVGVNGSFFDVANGLPLNGCLIRDGVIINASPTTGHEICITDKGEIFSPGANVEAQKLIEAGVRDILITTDPLLLQGGVPYTEGSLDITGFYPRTAIGMVKPGEYYLLTAEGQGLTYSQMQTIFYELGCTFARSVDGGSSVALMFGQQKLTSGTRPVGDFLFFLPR